MPYSRNSKQEQERAPEVRCSRERSRAAWKVIEEVWEIPLAIIIIL
jgi:hypothetical protein